MIKMKRGAQILLVSKDGSLILQQRDNNPDIINPGMVTAFGGSVEDDETTLDAAQRELCEETNIRQLQSKDFVHYGSYKKTKEIHGEDREVDYFVIRNVSTDKLKVFEGQGFVTVHSLDELKTLNASTLMREVASDWFSGWRDFLFMPEPSEEMVRQISDTYYRHASKNLSPTPHKVAICPAGLVASGKSSVCEPLARRIKAVKISSDELREELYKKRYNFVDTLAEIVNELVLRAIEDRYNIYLDKDCSKSVDWLNVMKEAGYKILLIHVDPGEDYIIHKITSGEMKHELSFFKTDQHVLRSFLQHKDAHYSFLAKLKEEFPVWAHADNSKDLEQTHENLAERISNEAGLA